MVALAHPTIVAGWFREISSQWPGQAMTLKVQRILHVEKSQYQDVLVFASETFGNVLVLDGVIQCTERDEFSYQEMIAHIPLASHPNPKKVLVIGGGDGGVVREVLRHDSVEEVVLCDIDEAVIRVSKKYLPHMSSLLSSPRVRVHIGDGFKFLADSTSTYDVIITDSSDPVGPATSLFQNPYFQLLHDALAPGGHISTQGECLWIHLPLIKDLLTNTRTIFPVCEYAFTTIPTYPSGQIGFIIASKEKGRDLATAMRKVEGTRYYNEKVHAAAFVLPEFASAMLEKGSDVRPQLIPTLPTDTKKRKVLLLGSGFVAKPAAGYIARDPKNEITVACRTLASARALASSLGRGSTATSLDIADTASLEAAVAAHDIVVDLAPAAHHAIVIRAAIKGKTHYVNTSYIKPEIALLDAEAREVGIVVLSEIGLDPGLDHLYAMKTIGEVHAKGGKIRKYLHYCGGIPAPEAASNPLGLKISWSCRGILLNLRSPARFISNNQEVTVPGLEVMASARPYYISPAFAFVGYPNRDSVPYREVYGVPEAETFMRGTLRYQGYPEFMDAIVKLGWLDEGEKGWLKEGMTWAEVLQRLIGAEDVSEAALIRRIDTIIAFPNDTERARIISGLRWIGLLSSTEEATVRAGNLLDTLCAKLEQLIQYKPGERDLVITQNKFVVQWKDGSEQTLTSTLERYGEPGGFSGMARATGIPCGIAVQLILDGVLATPGVYGPYTAEVCDPIRGLVEAEGLGFVEQVL